MLREYGYDVVPVNPVLDEIEGVEVKHSLDEVENNPDTLSVYVRPEDWRGCRQNNQGSSQAYNSKSGDRIRHSGKKVQG
jgi:predicted CoA-binding protein